MENNRGFGEGGMFILSSVCAYLSLSHVRFPEFVEKCRFPETVAEIVIHGTGVYSQSVFFVSLLLFDISHMSFLQFNIEAIQ
jgi:hypothetical protein